jgi:hypothetical protein
VVQFGRGGRLCLDFDEHEPAMSKLKDIEWLFNGRHFDREIIVLCVRWYLRQNLVVVFQPVFADVVDVVDGALVNVF